MDKFLKMVSKIKSNKCHDYFGIKPVMITNFE
jgi:hypothetical protein